ncbi:MAG: diaminopimelate decarboxylase [Chloroflexi bacterium]|nr:MAG: diaminopimelate decarboxylase [Chloroflexota bacterium]
MFHYQNKQLFCEKVSLTELAAKVGTPAYIYSEQSLQSRAAQFQPKTASRLVCYATKANSNPTLLRLLQHAGLGADVTSGGELFLARHAGFAPEKIIFSGVGKTDGEIVAALDADIKALHVESAAELARIQHIAAGRQQIARIGIRINPNIDAQTHPYISTGQKRHKFGVDPETAVSLFHTAAQHPWLEPVGAATHIGSQITSLAPYQESTTFLLDFAEKIAADGIRLHYLDVGGGLGIDYESEPMPAIDAWVTAVSTPINAAGYNVVLEPGRSIMGPTGILLTQVIYTKSSSARNFAIVDAGMNDLLRPTLYKAHHPILPINKPRPDIPTTLYDIVGPVCESSDWLAKAQSFPPLKSGDLLAVTHAGAYGFAMSSNYNGRLRPPELLINNDQYQIIRQRQTFESLLDGC